MAGSGMFTTKGARKDHLMRGTGGVAAEVLDLREDLTEEFSPLLALTVEELTNPAAASANALLAATATGAAGVVVVLQEKDLLLAGRDALKLSPRQLVFTTAGATPANAPASVLIEGLNNFGKPVKETLALAQTATTATSVNAYSKITRLTFAASDGAVATIAIGWSVVLYVTRKPKTREGLVLVYKEVMDGAEIDPVTGTLDAAGVYTPAAAPNGARNYAVVFEYDPTF